MNNYYSSLSKSPSLSPSRIKANQKEKSIKHKTVSQSTVNARVYADDAHSGQKLDKLHELMQKEYMIEEATHNLDPTLEQIEEAVVGYPSFMRESTSRVK